MEYTFPDGCHYRIEVSGIERAWIFRKLVKKFQEAGILWHRAICCVRGAGAPRPNPMAANETLWGFYAKEELREFAKIGAGEGVEVIMTPFTRPTYQDGAVQAKSPQGIISGMSWRGLKAVNRYIEDILRLHELGFRGFLTWRKGTLRKLYQSANSGIFPNDIILKLSVFDGNANPDDAEEIMDIVNYSSTRHSFSLTINPVTDLTVEMLREIRTVLVNTPMDVHSRIFDSWGGNNRIKEAYNIVKATSPIYFKDEPGPRLEMYEPAFPEKTLWEYKLSAVEAARQIIDNINRGNEKYGTNFKISEWGPNDLRLPIVHREHETLKTIKGVNIDD